MQLEQYSQDAFQIRVCTYFQKKPAKRKYTRRTTATSQRATADVAHEETVPTQTTAPTAPTVTPPSDSDDMRARVRRFFGGLDPHLYDRTTIAAQNGRMAISKMVAFKEKDKEFNKMVKSTGQFSDNGNRKFLKNRLAGPALSIASAPVSKFKHDKKQNFKPSSSYSQASKDCPSARQGTGGNVAQSTNSAAPRNNQAQQRHNAAKSGNAGGGRNRLEMAHQEEEDDPVYTLEEALTIVGIGKFQYMSMCYAGLGYITDAAETMILSFIGPALRSQWTLSPTQESLITTVVFAGMVFGAVFWGFITDTYGRRRGLLSVAIVTAVSAAVSTFSPNYNWLLVVRMMVGFGVGGGPLYGSWFLEFVGPSTCHQKKVATAATADVAEPTAGWDTGKGEPIAASTPMATVKGTAATAVVVKRTAATAAT
ncbi:uncharacterized protein LOC132619662 [Lycium barbarum]|uniref:uncharacterized protein LOC132619662 n=1 Tax=Lycium barbarum TaxID=112863 RepID=UPI00293E7011|nr:uncharacterized protein LOC132619662 [Lycium barbarum]